MRAAAVAGRLPAEELTTFVTDVFRACGVGEDDARDAASALCYADLNGIDSHGVVNLERIYVPRLLAGEIDARAEPVIEQTAAATATIDARRGLGLVVGTRAIELALELAAGSGAGVVGVRNSTHFGSAGYYASLAAAAGAAAISLTNLGGQRIAPPPGASTPVAGTNPIGAALPAGREPALVLDMSTTAVSTGRIRGAARRGEQIPPGWLADRDGPVTDPGTYDRGEAVLQWLGGDAESGGFKGFGLGLLVEALCGVLTGARDAPSRGPAPAADSGDEDIGHLFIVLSIPALRPIDEFRQGMDRMLGGVLRCRGWDGEPISYPGAHEAATAAHRRAEGIPIGDELRSSLEAVAERVGVAPPVLGR